LAAQHSDEINRRELQRLSPGAGSSLGAVASSIFLNLLTASQPVASRAAMGCSDDATSGNSRATAKTAC
jgi:hypothetical protein